MAVPIFFSFRFFFSLKKKEKREKRRGTEQTWGGVFGVSILRFPFEAECSFQRLVAGTGGEREG